MSQLYRLFPGQDHGLNPFFLKGSHVQHKALADGGDVLHLPDSLGHDWGTAYGQHYVGHIPRRHVVGDAVDTWRHIPYYFYPFYLFHLSVPSGLYLQPLSPLPLHFHGRLDIGIQQLLHVLKCS